MQVADRDHTMLRGASRGRGLDVRLPRRTRSGGPCGTRSGTLLTTGTSGCIPFTPRIQLAIAREFGARASRQYSERRAEEQYE
jgi:hypothetical protein